MASQDQEELGRAVKRRRTSWSSYTAVRREQPDPAVMRLPIEILLAIFHLLSHDEEFLGAASRAWISTTQVCQHWRNIALSNPTLWRTIVIRSDLRWFNCALMALQRSGQATLEISVVDAMCYADADPIWSVIAGEMHRIRTLDVEAPDDSLFPLACTSLPISAPQLRSLSVAGGHRFTSQGIFTSLDTLTLAGIRSLKITPSKQLTNSWHQFQHMASLKHLTIHNGYHLLRLEDVVAALSSLPRLESLTIDDRSRIFMETASHGIRTTLPSLRLLRLLADVDDCVVFLETLELPPQARILTYTSLGPNPSRPPHPATWQRLVASLCALAVSADKTHRHLDATQVFDTGPWADRSIRIAWYGDEDDLRAFAHEDQLSPLTLAAYSGVKHHPIEDIFPKDLLASIDALCVSQDSAWTKGPCVAEWLVRHCNNVQILECDYAMAMRSQAVVELLGCVDTVPFPKLHTIYLTSVHWSPCHLHDGRSCDVGDMCPFLHALARRQSLGHSISRLVVGKRSTPASMPKEVFARRLAPFVLEEITWAATDE